MPMTPETQGSQSILILSILALLVICSSLLLPSPFTGSFQSGEPGVHNWINFSPYRDSITCYEFFSPFSESDRQSFPLIKKRVVGVYGEYRRSYKPGHHHAGLDLWGAFNETVYPIGYGWVVRVFREFPHRSVVVEHHLSDGDVLYSMYVHIEDIKVKVGDWVDERTAMARVFNQKELDDAKFNTPNHLHLEIRKSLADRGRASYASMSMRILNRVCLDPLQFFKKLFNDS